jgi:branched-chain amino acid transport system substrate-binding protein
MRRFAAKSRDRFATTRCVASGPLSGSSFRKLLPTIFAFVLIATTGFAQSGDSPAPYASMNRDEVAYRGPDRRSMKDLSGDVVTIGIILPLHGPRVAQGTALRAAAQMALDDELASTSGTPGRRLALAFRDESERWGQASSEMVELIDQQQAIALITGPDGNIAHQAEQIANKIGIPILTLSSDATTTRINIPWIFRFGPSDADQSKLIASDVYQRRNLRKVLLLAEDDHDGRVGSEEFMRAAKSLEAAAPERVDFNPASDLASLADTLKSKPDDAIVLWSGPEAADRLLSVMRQATPSVAIYLCSKAAQLATPSSQQAWFTAVLVLPMTDRASEFAVRYRGQTGLEPTAAAREIYDAVHLLAAAIRTAGPNRARVRDYLASGVTYSGVSGAFSFDKAGNIEGEYVLQRAAEPPIQAAF